MKKVIERMDLAVRRAQALEVGGAPQGQGVGEKGGEGKEKEKGRKWGILGGKKKDGAGSGSAGDSAGGKEAAATGEQQGQEAPEGLRVDQYLVVFLKFMSSIGELFLSLLLLLWREEERRADTTSSRLQQSPPSK